VPFDVCWPSGSQDSTSLAERGNRPPLEHRGGRRQPPATGGRPASYHDFFAAIHGGQWQRIRLFLRISECVILPGIATDCNRSTPQLLHHKRHESWFLRPRGRHSAPAGWLTASTSAGLAASSGICSNRRCLRERFSFAARPSCWLWRSDEACVAGGENSCLSSCAFAAGREATGSPPSCGSCGGRAEVGIYAPVLEVASPGSLDTVASWRVGLVAWAVCV
jgi:hypothetical protein